MEFDKKLAKKIIEEHGLNPNNYYVWCSRGVIPEKYGSTEKSNSKPTWSDSPTPIVDNELLEELLLHAIGYVGLSNSMTTHRMGELTDKYFTLLKQVRRKK